jgi:hypothetical protein
MCSFVGEDGLRPPVALPTIQFYNLNSDSDTKESDAVDPSRTVEPTAQGGHRPESISTMVMSVPQPNPLASISGGGSDRARSPTSHSQSNRTALTSSEGRKEEYDPSKYTISPPSVVSWRSTSPLLPNVQSESIDHRFDSPFTVPEPHAQSDSERLGPTTLSSHNSDPSAADLVKASRISPTIPTFYTASRLIRSSSALPPSTVIHLESSSGKEKPKIVEILDGEPSPMIETKTSQRESASQRENDPSTTSSGILSDAVGLWC